MTDWGSLQGMTAEIEAAAAKALASPSGAPAGAADAAGMQPADAHMQMRWALLLQDQVRQVQQHVQREQARPRLQPPARAAPNRTPHPARD